MRVSAGLLVLLMLTTTTRAQLSADASQERFWVAWRVMSDGHRAASHTSVLQRDLGVGGEWREVHRSGLRVIDIGHRGGDAAIVLENGSWRLVAPGFFTAPEPMPDGLSMRRLASWPGGFYALGEVTSDSSATTRRAGTRPGATDGLPRSGQWTLHRFAGNQWSRLALLEDPLLPRPGDLVSLTTHAGRAAVAVSHGDGTVHIARFDEAGKPEMLPPVSVPRLREIKLLGAFPRLTLAVEQDNGEMRLLALDGDRWTESSVLSLDARIAAARWRAVAVVGGNITVVAEHEDGLVEQSFGASGQPLGEARGIELKAPGQRGQAEYWLNLLIMLVLLVVMFTTLRQRPMPTPEQMRERRLELAPHSLRLLAGLIDVSTALAASLYVGWRTGNDTTALDVLSTTELVVVGVLTALYPIHTTIGELLAGRSVGKLLCGLRVRDISGGEASSGAILIRNFVRVPDTLLLFPLAFILLSPLRQRVGDMAAGTIVVRDVEEPATGGDDDAGA
jgi:uncharacterized RDD family membrane protein YckC